MRNYALHNAAVHLEFWAPRLASCLVVGVLCGAAGSAIGAISYYGADLALSNSGLDAFSTLAASIGIATLIGLVVATPIFITIMMPYYEQVFEKEAVTKGKLVPYTQDELYNIFDKELCVQSPQYLQPELQERRKELVDERVQKARSEVTGRPAKWSTMVPSHCITEADIEEMENKDKRNGTYHKDKIYPMPDLPPIDENKAKQAERSSNWKHRVDIHHGKSPYDVYRGQLL